MTKINTVFRVWHRRTVNLSVVLLIFQLLVVSTLVAAPKKDLWDFWNKHNANSREKINHDEWDQLLQKYIVEKNNIHFVQYKSINAADKKILQNYITRLSNVDIFAYSKPEQMAYWINLYNAETWRLIVDAYPVDSIMDIGFGFISFGGPWDEKLLKIKGQDLSLNDIEHRILRPIWNDERIHYAVNCASIGCPNIANEAYRADNLERLLNEGRVSYINHPRGVTLAADNSLTLSSIFDWYQIDFAKNESDLTAYLATYILDPKIKAALVSGDYSGIDYEYDWDLNEP